jgi:penicillin-insensitive murein endopeptidase
MKFLILCLAFVSVVCAAETSTCYGTTSKGRLVNGVQLPAEGNNFVGYSTVARLAGRTYAHSEVRDIIINAYTALEKEQPDKEYKYAETGFEKGGIFKPHKTHQNGLSVDFMTPVLTPDGDSASLPTHPFNQFGYAIEFDTNDKYEGFSIDYLALAAHIVALHKEANAKNYDLWRVIFDPELQSNLFKTKYGFIFDKMFNFQKNLPG